MKIDTLYRKVEDTYFKHSVACRELTTYIIDNVVEDFDDYVFYDFAIVYQPADGLALTMCIEEDKKQKIDTSRLDDPRLCNLDGLIEIYKKEKRKITIKEIFKNSF